MMMSKVIRIWRTGKCAMLVCSLVVWALPALSQDKAVKLNVPYYIVSKDNLAVHMTGPGLCFEYAFADFVSASLDISYHISRRALWFLRGDRIHAFKGGPSLRYYFQRVRDEGYLEFNIHYFQGAWGVANFSGVDVGGTLGYRIHLSDMAVVEPYAGLAWVIVKLQDDPTDTTIAPAFGIRLGYLF